MRVVIVGATGNVGSVLLEQLSMNDSIEEIRALARRPPESTWPKTRFAAIDASKDDLQPHLLGADAVVHLAWLFQPTHHPLVTWQNNVGGALRVLDAAASQHVPILIFASSVGAYSPNPGGDYVDESWPTHGSSSAAYGREKAYVERLLDAFELSHPEVRVVRLRTGFVFQGAAASQQLRLFAGPLLPTPALQGGRLPFLPYPAGLRLQALHAEDAATGYRLALLGNSRGAFNLAADPVLDAAGVARVLRSRPIEVPPRLVRSALALSWRAHLVPADPALFDMAMGLPLMSTARARTELGWEPRVSASSALEEFWTGLMRGEGGATPPLRADSLVGRLRGLRSAVGRGRS